jgi:hypothetical protein
MRDYHLAWELRQAGLDWQTWLLRRWAVEGPLLTVAQLKADASFASEEARAQAFVAQDAGCRATYFNYARKLKQTKPAPAMRLTATSPPIRGPEDGLLALFKRRFGNLGSE